MVKLSVNIWPIDLVFMSTFDNQSMNIGCVRKLGHLFGFLRHNLLRPPLRPSKGGSPAPGSL